MVLFAAIGGGAGADGPGKRMVPPPRLYPGWFPFAATRYWLEAVGMPNQLGAYRPRPGTLTPPAFSAESKVIASPPFNTSAAAEDPPTMFPRKEAATDAAAFA